MRLYGFSLPVAFSSPRAFIVSRQGRFGKYGDVKRRTCLRNAGTRLLPTRVMTEGGRHPFMRSRRISIRRADRYDIGFIGRLSAEVFSVYGPYGHLVPEWFESDLTVTLIAIVGGLPSGFVMMGRLFGSVEKENRCELLAIAVEPHLHRRGIGGMLLRKIQKEAERLGESTLILHTAVDNFPAQDLFRKHGFISLSLKRHFYPSGRDAVMMKKAV